MKMAMKPIASMVAAMGLLTGLVCEAEAGVVVSNLGLGTFPSYFSQQLVGQSFQVGPQTSTLDSVVVGLFNGTLVSQSFSISLYDNVSSAPGSSILSLGSVSTLAGTDLTYTFTPSVAFTLNASTTYWLVVNREGNASADAGWGGTTDLTSTGSGSLGSVSAFVGGSWLSSSQERAQIQVNGSPVAQSVPEPSMLLLVGAAGLAASWANRRGRRGDVSATRATAA
jgi:hypothetical protein